MHSLPQGDTPYSDSVVQTLNLGVVTHTLSSVRYPCTHSCQWNYKVVSLLGNIFPKPNKLVKKAGMLHFSTSTKPNPHPNPGSLSNVKLVHLMDGLMRKISNIWNTSNNSRTSLAFIYIAFPINVFHI